MRHKIIPMLFCVVLTGILVSCSGMSEEEKREAEIAAITRSIDSCIGWFKDKDFDLLFSVVAHDSNYVSVHPTNKVIMGFEQFEKNAEVFKYSEFRPVDKKTISDVLCACKREHGF